MQSFHDWLPPPPPVGHSWKRIDRWAEDNYVELFDNMCEGCTQNDVNELEHTLDVSLPMDLRESLQFHDGQERGGNPTGVIFGLMLLDCEEIIQEWQNWKTVADEYLNPGPTLYRTPSLPTKAFAGAQPSSSSAAGPSSQAPGASQGISTLLARQTSQPPNAIQSAYAHPGWIPIARDWGGNYLAVDLAPGPAGRWGQVIIFGRDYDCKYVVGRAWGAFLAGVADDLGDGMNTKAYIEEDSGELKLRVPGGKGIEPGYLDILRWRADQKYGRRQPPRRLSRNPNGLRVNSQVAADMPSAGLNGGSPYGSPTSTPGSVTEERGRSPNRFSTGSMKQKATSPSNRPSMLQHASSPLARVAEEDAKGIRLHTNLSKEDRGLNDSKANKVISVDTPRPGPKEGPDSLIAMESPRPSEDAGPGAGLLSPTGNQVDGKESNKENKKTPVGLGVEEMKTVEI